MSFSIYAFFWSKVEGTKVEGLRTKDKNEGFNTSVFLLRALSSRRYAPIVLTVSRRL